jgi:hypothetical protein
MTDSAERLTNPESDLDKFAREHTIERDDEARKPQVVRTIEHLDMRRAHLSLDKEPNAFGYGIDHAQLYLEPGEGLVWKNQGFSNRSMDVPAEPGRTEGERAVIGHLTSVEEDENGVTATFKFADGWNAERVNRGIAAFFGDFGDDREPDSAEGDDGRIRNKYGFTAHQWFAYYTDEESEPRRLIPFEEWRGGEPQGLLGVDRESDGAESGGERDLSDDGLWVHMCGDRRTLLPVRLSKCWMCDTEQPRDLSDHRWTEEWLRKVIREEIRNHARLTS